MTKIKYKYKITVFYFLVASSISLVANYSVFSDYAFLDANEYLYTSSRSVDFNKDFLSSGRPLLALLCKLMYSSAKTIANLKFIRLFTLLLCVIFSTQIFYFLIKNGLKKFESVCFALLVLAIPCFSIYIAWTTTIQAPIVLITCFYAGTLLLKDITSPKTLYIKTFIAFLLILTSMFLYQATITIIIVPFVMHCMIHKEFSLKTAFKFVFVTALIYVIYYIIFKLFINGFNIDATNRTTPNLSGIPKKLIKFYLIELRFLVTNSAYFIAPKISTVIGVICLLAFLLKEFKAHKSFIFIGFLVFTLAYGYSPNILSGQDYFSVRTIATSAVLVAFYQFWFLRDVCKNNKFLKSVVICIVIFLIAISMHNQNKYLAGLQHKEYVTLQKEFLNIDIKNINKIQVIVPKHDFLQLNNYYNIGISDEFGRLSSARDWAVKHLFCQLQWEALNTRNSTLNVFSPDNVIVIKSKDEFLISDYPIIDLKKSFHSTFSTIEN
jgi:hypothetical protein